MNHYLYTKPYLFISHDFLHGICKHKWCTLSLDTQLVFEITQNVSKVNVKVVAKLGHHEIVIVSVSQAQHIAGYAVRSSRDDEVTRSLGNFGFFDRLVLIVAHGLVRLHI